MKIHIILLSKNISHHYSNFIFQLVINIKVIFPLNESQYNIK